MRRTGSAALVCVAMIWWRIEAVDTEVIATLAEDVLRPAVFEQAVAFALDDLAPAGADRARRQLEGELRTVTAECERLARGDRARWPTRSLTGSPDAPGAPLRGLRAELAAYPAALPTFDRGALERRVRGKLADRRGLLTLDVAAGNAMLRTLLAEPTRFTPVREERRVGYRFQGRIALDRIIAGLIPVPELTAKLHHLGTSPAEMVASWIWMEGVTEYLRAA